MMKVVIVGGGKIGYYLTKTLMPYHHNITIIEKDRNTCTKMANELNIPVIHGDGTNIENLKEAGVSEADIFITVTGKDEDNLISCQLAKKNFGVKRTISNVNNPKNISIFKTLGVDYATSSTLMLAEVIEQEVDYAGIKTLMKLKSGKVVMNEIMIDRETPICNKPLKDLKMPKDCVLISVIRGDEVIIPNGYTAIHKGDCIIAIASEIDHEALMKFFLV